MAKALRLVKREKPGVLRRDFRQTDEPGILLRRAIVDASLIELRAWRSPRCFRRG
jgi:hypothetical protein